MYVLDTDIIIELLRKNKKVIESIEKLPENIKIYTTIINVAELYYGAYHSQQQHKQLAKVKNIERHFRILPLTQYAIIEYGQIKSNLNKKGTPVADNDVFIASIAKTNNLILVTHNTKHFERILNLDIEDWLINLNK